MRTLRIAVFIPVLLSGCGSLTVPAAVKMDSGEAFIGTTTAAMSGGTFSVNDPSGAKGCSGTYDPFDTRPVISAPFRCSDGRYGTITVTRNADMRSGNGIVTLSDGSKGRLAFGADAAGVLQPSQPTVSAAAAVSEQSSSATTTPSYALNSSSMGFASLPSTYSPSASSSGRVYTGNCPTPDSYDAAGRRCGARSAASRPGGYNGYGSWASTSYGGGSTYVRGYFRKNGTYVRPHYRRR